MLKKLFGKPPVDVWVVKQVDENLIHLCGHGTLESQDKRKTMLEALARGEFRGAVRLAGGGLVLNARLFAALVPLNELTLTDDDQAYWQGRLWRVSQVPQRCWSFDGRLVAQQVISPGGPGLVSSEDVSGIRGRVGAVTPPPTGEVTFRPDNELEPQPPITQQHDPAHPPKLATRREPRDDDKRH